MKHHINAIVILPYRKFLYPVRFIKPPDLRKHIRKMAIADHSRQSAVNISADFLFPVHQLSDETLQFFSFQFTIQIQLPHHIQHCASHIFIDITIPDRTFQQVEIPIIGVVKNIIKPFCSKIPDQTIQHILRQRCQFHDQGETTPLLKFAQKKQGKKMQLVIIFQIPFFKNRLLYRRTQIRQGGLSIFAYRPECLRRKGFAPVGDLLYRFLY